jgi:hypothetical protein
MFNKEALTLLFKGHHFGKKGHYNTPHLGEIGTDTHWFPQLCDHYAYLLFVPIHPIVHWLPNKRFAWPQSYKGFVNMVPCSEKSKLHGVQYVSQRDKQSGSVPGESPDIRFISPSPLPLFYRSQSSCRICNWNHLRPFLSCWLQTTIWFKELNLRRRVYAEIPKPTGVELKCSQNLRPYSRGF